MVNNPLQFEDEREPKPKLVRIIARLNVGGAAQQACMLHEKLLPHFDTYLVVGRLAEGESDMSYLLSSERNVLRLPQLSRQISLISDPVTFWRIFRFLRRVRPAVVHTHTAKAGALGRLAAWMAGVPVIVHTYHGHVFHGYFNRFSTSVFMAVERALGSISTRIIAISESQRRDLAVKYKIASPNKISVVHNGFNLERFSQADRQQARASLGLGADDFAAVWAGRLVPVKDVDLLGTVILKMSARNPRMRFLVVGDGEEKAKLVSLIAGCANVQLLGWRRDMEKIWSAADAALLTSRNEGTPTALIEAMAAGVPFVATNVGAVSDIAIGPFHDLPNGFGVQAANGFLTAQTSEALIDCLDFLATRPEIARQMALAGRAFVHERFSTNRLVDDLLCLYKCCSPIKGELLGAEAAGQVNERDNNAQDAI